MSSSARRRASPRGVRALALALRAGALTLLAAVLAGPIGVAVILALVCSFVLSMTLVPALAGLLVSAGGGPGRLRWWRAPPAADAT